MDISGGRQKTALFAKRHSLIFMVGASLPKVNRILIAWAIHPNRILEKESVEKKSLEFQTSEQLRNRAISLPGETVSDAESNRHLSLRMRLICSRRRLREADLPVGRPRVPKPVLEPSLFEGWQSAEHVITPLDTSERDVGNESQAFNAGDPSHNSAVMEEPVIGSRLHSEERFSW
ncbi:hypothetical protein CEXT_399051 [Caerostris extrusa]|uniref:Uncharacterized protein n=1 Tax=Caerostris extrusa TaxID=172846 RepID=A0AAV4Y907_CAEEX|nr:hypothetical protein CEXT_399051 [Caerostris extrusa]